MREALQSSRCPIYLKKRVYIWSYGEMSLKLGQNINFRPFLDFSNVFGRDTVFLVVTKFSGLYQVFWLQHNFLVATKFLNSNLFFFSNFSGPELLHFNSDLGM